MSALDTPAVIAGSVNLPKFTEALARAGLVGRHDAERGVLVIEPAPAPCRHCGGAGHGQDGADLPPRTAQERPGDALMGMAVYNSWSRQERAEWHQRAGSAVPADAWEAFKMGESRP